MIGIAWLQQILNKIGANDDAASMSDTLFAGQQSIYDALSGVAAVKPVKNQAFILVFPIYDNTQTLISGASGLDSEISKDGGSFADCTNEATEIGSTGVYTLSLTATEMNADYIMVSVKTTSSNASQPLIAIYTN